MALDGKLLGRALDRLDELNKRDERELNKLRRRVYDRLPRVAQIDRTIAQSFAEAAFAALDSGSANPEEALAILLANQNEENFPLSESVERESMAVLLPLMETEDAPFLSQSDACWQENIDWMRAQGLIDGEIAVEDVRANLLYGAE